MPTSRKRTRTEFSIPLTIKIVEVSEAESLSPEDSCQRRWFVKFSLPIPKDFETETLAIEIAKAAVITEYRHQQKALLDSLRRRLRKAGETGISKIIKDASSQHEKKLSVFERNLTGRMALENLPWIPCQLVIVELPKTND